MANIFEIQSDIKAVKFALRSFARFTDEQQRRDDLRSQFDKIQNLDIQGFALLLVLDFIPIGMFFIAIGLFHLLLVNFSLLLLPFICFWQTFHCYWSLKT
jgi:uncharacterized membrane protein